jgi:hypothetical protein
MDNLGEDAGPTSAVCLVSTNARNLTCESRECEVYTTTKLVYHAGNIPSKLLRDLAIGFRSSGILTSDIFNLSEQPLLVLVKGLALTH